jgi:hypothetical protein
VLHKRRKWQQKLAERETAGESFWSESFDAAARNKILLAFQAATQNVSTFFEVARSAILRDEGMLYLVDSHITPVNDLLNYLLNCPDDMMPTVIESMSLACSNRAVIAHTGVYDSVSYFDETVNVVLREHRISYELIDHQMVEFTSKELHQEVIAPALRLLAGRKDLAGVEEPYQAALAQISKGESSNAITDAGTALQEMLQALGCVGNSLGPLIKSARDSGLLAKHDSPMLGAVVKILDWVSADRSESGDAHEVSAADIDDAWFTVHVVGAIILRLSKAKPRLY